MAFPSHALRSFFPTAFAASDAFSPMPVFHGVELFFEIFLDNFIFPIDEKHIHIQGGKAYVSTITEGICQDFKPVENVTLTEHRVVYQKIHIQRRLKP